jgi:hypothetical protein
LKNGITGYHNVNKYEGAKMENFYIKVEDDDDEEDTIDNIFKIVAVILQLSNREFYNHRFVLTSYTYDYPKTWLEIFTYSVKHNSIRIYPPLSLTKRAI